MAKSITARRKGDDYQSRFFWIQLLKLRTDDFVEEVIFESDEDTSIDDIVVTYNERILDKINSRYYVADYIQCKYHVTDGGAFSSELILDPDFIHAKESFLKKLYVAYARTINKHEDFRIIIASNWSWHPDDIIALHMEEGRIRPTFWNKGLRSKEGKKRQIFCNHLMTKPNDLKNFLDHLVYDGGYNLTKLETELNYLLKLNSLKTIDPRKFTCLYDDLAWKLFGAGTNRYSKEKLSEILQNEDLILPKSTHSSEILIKSFKLHARKPADAMSSQLDLTPLFDNRYAKNINYWGGEIPNQIKSFMNTLHWDDNATPKHFYFDCHLSISFCVGAYINPKYGFNIIPMHKSLGIGYEKWGKPSSVDHFEWIITPNDKIGNEAVLVISISTKIESEVTEYLLQSKLDHLPRFNISPRNGVGQQIISSGNVAWSMCYTLREKLRDYELSNTKLFHLFISAPATYSFILGSLLGYVWKNIQLYEYDFDGGTYSGKYIPTIKISK